MASSWIEKRQGKTGVRFRVCFRTTGWAKDTYGGSFKTKREALARKQWIDGELAAMRVPDVRLLGESKRGPTLTEAAERWRSSRVDVAESTRVLHRVALDRVLPILGTRPVDEITTAEVAALVAQLHAASYKRETIYKSVTALAMVLDFAGAPLVGKDTRGHAVNAARDRTTVRLPREEREELEPPTASHVAAVYRTVPSVHRLPLLFLDWSGVRVKAIDTLLVGDYDEPGGRVRLRAATTKTRRALWVELNPDLAEALSAALGPREDRDPDARLFAASGSDALRTSIAKACRALGIPLWSPHDLRHRRISLLHLKGVPWVRIGEQVGQRDLAVTANTYSHVMLDEGELDYAELLT